MTELPPDTGYVTTVYPGAGDQDTPQRLLSRLASAILPVRVGRAATAWAASHRGPGWFNNCLRFVRSSFNVPGGYSTAHESWLSTVHRHAFTLSPPVGVPIWWSDSTNWHVALSDGAGWCWSTDILRHGYVDRVPVSLIQKAWGLGPVGWAEEINAVRVYTPPPPPKPVPVPVPKPVPVPPTHRKDRTMMTIIVGRTGYVWTGNIADKPVRIDVSYDETLKPPGPSKLWADTLSQFPGTPLAIPQGLKPPHPLSVALGFEPAPAP